MIAVCRPSRPNGLSCARERGATVVSKEETEPEARTGFFAFCFHSLFKSSAMSRRVAARARRDLALREGPGLTVSLETTTAANCPTDDGVVSATVMGGSGTYVYSWSPGTSATDTLSAVAGGATVSLTVTDSSDSSLMGSAQILMPCQCAVNPTVSIDQQVNPQCPMGMMGSITTTTSGGTGPYTFQWSSGETVEDITGLSAGSYTLTVLDSNNCGASSGPIVLVDPPAFAIALDTQTNVACMGASTGALSVTTTGGTGSYVGFEWTNAASNIVGNSEDLENVPAGTYTLTVTDTNMCIGVSASFTITEASSMLMVAVESTTPVTCNGDSDGEATISFTGGDGQVDISWAPNTMDTSATVTGLSAGTYTATVVDMAGAGCTRSVEVQITEPAVVSGTVAVTPTLCDFASGTATAIFSGGNGDDTFLWSPNGATTETIAGLTEGMYTVTVTNQCGSAMAVGDVQCNGNSPTGTPEFVVGMSSVLTESDSCPGTEFCLVSAQLYGGVALQSVQMELNEFPVGATIVEPPLVNPFYAGVGNSFNGGCDSGVSIFNPSSEFRDCNLRVSPPFTPAAVPLSTWVGRDATNNACINYLSIASEPNGLVTVPVAQLAFNNLNSGQVSGNFTFVVGNSMVAYPYAACCGCGCASIQQPAPPFACNVPVDFNAIDRTTNSGLLNQFGFLSMQFDATRPLGTTLVSSEAGYTITIIGGDEGFNNAFQNSFPATPNNLMIDGIKEDIDSEFIGVSLATLQQGTWIAKVWIFDQAEPDLAPHIAYWGTYDSLNPTPPPSVNATGLLQPQPFPYDNRQAFGENAGPFAGSFMVEADGVSEYQLVVRSSACEGGSSPECKSRFNGFSLELIDETPPELTCNNVRIDVTECGAIARWCEPSSLSDNCPLPDPGLQQTPISQTGGPSQDTFAPIGNYVVMYEAIDVAGNVGTCAFDFVVADVLGPTLSFCPSDIVVSNDPGECFATPTFDNPPANTNCDTALNYTYTPLMSGDMFPVGVTNVTLVVSDNVGRSDTCQFQVTVIDVETPVLCIPPQDVTLPCGPAYDAWLSSGGFAQFDSNCPVVLEPIFEGEFCGEQPVIAGPVTWRVVNNASASNMIIGPATFVTADSSCVCNVLTASAVVTPDFVACSESDLPDTRNVTITLEGATPRSAFSDKVNASAGYVPPSYTFTFQRPGGVPRVITTNDVVLELELGPGRWSFIITNERDHLFATLCIDIPVCGNGLSEMWVVERPNDAAATVLTYYSDLTTRIEVGATLLGSSAVQVNGIAWRPLDNVLFGVSSATSPNSPSSLVTLDPATGAVSVIGVLNADIRDISIVNTALVGISFQSSSVYYSINEFTGAAIPIGGQFPAGSGTGIGLAAIGLELVATDSSVVAGSHLFNINVTTGVPTLIVDLLPTTTSYGPLAYDQNGQLFAAEVVAVPDTCTIVSLDQVTGLATVAVATAPGVPLTGLAFRYF